MAGKRDELFILGEEQLGEDSFLAAPEGGEEPDRSAPQSQPTHAPRFGAARAPVAGALVVATAIVLIASLGGGGGTEGPAPPQESAAPRARPAPQVISPLPADQGGRPRRHPRVARRPRPRRQSSSAGSRSSREVAAAETSAAAPTIAIAPAPPSAAPAAEPAPVSPPAPSSPVEGASVRPEFGIER
jgi:hypothetical protein